MLAEEKKWEIDDQRIFVRLSTLNMFFGVGAFFTDLISSKGILLKPEVQTGIVILGSIAVIGIINLINERKKLRNLEDHQEPLYQTARTYFTKNY